MKKLFIAALLTIFLTGSAFAKDGLKVNKSIQSNFNHDFKNATNVQWHKSGDLVRAVFVLDNVRTNAFYDYKGQLIGSSQAFDINNLPTSAKRIFAKKYADYTVTEAIEFKSLDEIAYFIAAKKDDKTVVLKVLNGHLSIFK